MQTSFGQKSGFNIILCLLLLCFVPICHCATAGVAYAETEADMAAAATEAADLPDVGQVADSMDWGTLDQSIQELQQYFSNTVDGLDLQSLWEEAKSGQLDLDFHLLWRIFTALFLKEVVASGALLVQLIILAAISLLLSNLKGSFGEGGVSTLSHGIVYLVLISIALQVFVAAGSAAKETVHMMSGFLYALAPMLLTLLVSMGGVTAVGLFHPAMLGAVGIAVNLINTLVLPLVYFSGALVVASYISPKLDISKMAKLFRDVSLGILSIIMTLFTAILGLLGVAGASIDGLAIKAAKSATGLFIPIVGRNIADVMDTVIGTSLILKNAIGVIGVVIIILLCVVPAIKILVMALSFRLTAALVQPLGDNQLSEALQGLGGVVMMFFAIVAASGIFFFFIISITIGMGNLTMAIR